MICTSRELAYRELSYVIAYQALKEVSSPDQRKTMVAEANALVVAIGKIGVGSLSHAARTNIAKNRPRRRREPIVNGSTDNHTSTFDE